ncbi:hypothetical protein C0991_005139 [Blastosporella zonata]|nr:hypothetical protein C0991_005139 [Blastosporella zonata]
MGDGKKNIHSDYSTSTGTSTRLSLISPPVIASFTTTSSATVTGNEPFCVTVTVSTTTSQPLPSSSVSDGTQVVSTFGVSSATEGLVRRQDPSSSISLETPIATAITTDSVIPTSSRTTTAEITATPTACTVTVTLSSSSVVPTTVTSTPITRTSTVSVKSTNSANTTGTSSPGSNSASTIGASVRMIIIALFAGIGAVLL